MRRCILIPVFSLLLVFYGCTTIQKPKRPEPEKIAHMQEKPVIGDEAEEIVEAIEYALSLESLLWDKREEIRERADVVDIFRKGFCEAKAQEITDYVWIEAIDRSGKKVYMLSSGEPLLAAPNSIEIVEKDNKSAQALLRYGENLEGPVTWSGHTIICSLKREHGVWKICETSVEVKGDE